MTGTSIDLAMKNLTQVEKLSSKTRTHVVAVLKPTPEQLTRVSTSKLSNLTYPEITYPLRNGQPTFPKHALSTVPSRISDNSALLNVNSEVNQRKTPFTGPTAALEDLSSVRVSDLHPDLPPTSLQNDQLTDPPGDHLEMTQKSSPLYSGRGNNEKPPEILSARDLKATRTFAILRMAQGENPWDLGSRYKNIETLMGTTIVDWAFPLRRSPCCSHEDPESHFSIGPSVDILKASVSFIEARNIRWGSNRRKPMQNTYLDVEAINHQPAKDRSRRQRRKRHRRRKHTDYPLTDLSLDPQNSPMQMADIIGNTTRVDSR